MLKFLYHHYPIFLNIAITGMIVIQAIALFVYYGNTMYVNLQDFNFLMMIYGLGMVTIFPFVVTLKATKHLSQHLLQRKNMGWQLGMTLNGVVCAISWLFSFVEVFIRKTVLHQSAQQIFAYTAILLIGSLLVLLLGGIIGWAAYKIALRK